MAEDYLIRIGDGIQGVKDTLYIMSRLTRRYKRHPGLVALARSLVSRLPGKDWGGEIAALHAFVRDHIRYVQDVNGVETLATPDRTLEIRQGDCDDKALLLATLLEAIGHPTRFVAVGEQPGELTHVLVETKVGEDWISLETTEPVEPGWFPPNVVNRFYVHN
jgi:transglutaminase-like putative cysteine protease